MWRKCSTPSSQPHDLRFGSGDARPGPLWDPSGFGGLKLGLVALLRASMWAAPPPLFGGIRVLCARPLCCGLAPRVLSARPRTVPLPVQLSAQHPTCSAHSQTSAHHTLWEVVARPPPSRPQSARRPQLSPAGAVGPATHGPGAARCPPKARHFFVLVLGVRGGEEKKRATTCSDDVATVETQRRLADARGAPHLQSQMRAHRDSQQRTPV